MSLLLRFHDPERGVRTGMRIANTIFDITDKVPTITTWLRASVGRVQSAIDDIEQTAQRSKLAYLASVLDSPSIPQLASLISPVETQDVWSTGISHSNVRAARENEAKVGGTVYANALMSPRPALMLRAQAGQVVAPYGGLGMRSDSRDTCAEPEFALLLNPALEVVGYTIATGMYARDIVSENPLYLPQAVHYNRAVSLGPGFVLRRLRSLSNISLRMSVSREKQVFFEGEGNTFAMQRDLDTIVEYLRRCGTFPDGVILMVGSGILMPIDCGLQVGDSVSVHMDGVGVLTNPVVLI
jgi:2-dehydro-3-deoxy-D-arabinonate dehydratase